MKKTSTQTSQKTKFTEYKNNVDLLIGGSPCQSFSTAGKELGFDDTRGTLFYEFARCVSECKPKYFIFENVKGLVSHDSGRTIDVVIETFKSLGYAITADILNTKDYGVPQNRERLFVVGSRDYEPVTSPKLRTGKLLSADKLHNKLVEKDVKYFDTYLFPEPIKLEKRLHDILEDDVDEKYFLTDEQVDRLTTSTYNIAKDRLQKSNGVCRTVTAREYKDPAVVRVQNSRIRKLTPLECWRLQDFPDEAFYKAQEAGVSNTQLYKQAGNSMSVNVVERLIGGLLKYNDYMI